jgi:hypothetical protein
MAYLSLAAVLSEMNQTEAQARSMLDLSVDTVARQTPSEEEEVAVKEEPVMATPPVPAVNIQDLVSQMLGPYNPKQERGR